MNSAGPESKQKETDIPENEKWEQECYHRNITTHISNNFTHVDSEELAKKFRYIGT